MKEIKHFDIDGHKIVLKRRDGKHDKWFEVFEQVLVGCMDEYSEEFIGEIDYSKDDSVLISEVKELY